MGRKLLQCEPLSGRAAIHSSLANSGKIFPERENDYAHGILERVGKYHLIKDDVKSIGELLSEQQFREICERKSWSGVPHGEMVETFEKLAVYCGKNDIKLADSRLDIFIDAMVELCFSFTDDLLLKTLRLLTHFPPSDGINSRNFVEIWSALDDACVERIDKWQTEQLLLVCDHWYALNLAKVCKCTFQATKKLGRKLKALSPTNLVQTMFYVNMRRKPLLDMFDFEVNLFESIDNLSLDEIAVMSMGFFKTETKIRNPELVDKIFQRVTAEIKTVQDISLVSIMKILRYSAKLQHIQLLDDFLIAVTPEIHRLSLLSCLHIALFGTDMQFYNHGCLEKVIERFAADLKSCRLKEFERLTFVMGLYCFTSPSGTHMKL
uniref:Fast kinase domain-containing protein 5 n=1 Tax=Lutzomyia longipalpis TaxID=7200 RepID=A0A1B0CGV9_LUTLO